MLGSQISNLNKYSGRSNSSTKRVSSEETPSQPPEDTSDPLEYLLSGSEDEDEDRVNTVQLEDSGSVLKCVPLLVQGVPLLVQGVPVTGLIDTGADLSIMGGELFKTVAVAAKLRKKDLHKVDKTPKTYDGKTFKLHGRLDLAIEFDSKTPVYLKMDSPERFILSEGVCRQLGIVQYRTPMQLVRVA